MLLEIRALKVRRAVCVATPATAHSTQAPQRRPPIFGDFVHFRLNFVVFSCPRQVSQPSFNDVYAMAPACVFAIVWHEGECVTTPWIFVNHNTSNAADLRHQNECSVTA